MQFDWLFEKATDRAHGTKEGNHHFWPRNILHWMEIQLKYFRKNIYDVITGFTALALREKLEKFKNEGKLRELCLKSEASGKTWGILFWDKIHFQVVHIFCMSTCCYRFTSFQLIIIKNVRQNLIKCVCFEKKSWPAKKNTCFERLSLLSKQIVKVSDQEKHIPFYLKLCERYLKTEEYQGKWFWKSADWQKIYLN